MTKHLKKFHEKSHNKPIIYHKCNKCDKKFNKKSNLKRHKRQVHKTPY